MVENYFNSGSSRRSFRGSGERRSFDCRPQQQKSSSLRNSCGGGPSTSAAARESYENCCCPQKTAATTSDCQTIKSEHMRSSSFCNSPPQQTTSLSPTRFGSCTTPKSRTSDFNSCAGVLSSTPPQSSYSMQRNSCRPSASSLIQDPCCNQSSANANIKTNANTCCCCCCPQCGKPQDPSQASTPPCPPSPKRSLPCRPKAHSKKEEQRPSPETEFKCRMRKLQMENLVKDQYCPGAIQSTIDCEEDFNEMSFRLVFGCDPLPCTLPPVEPISLLEALCMRIELERCLLNNESSYSADQRRGSRRGSSEIDEVDDYFSKKYKTALNEALASLLKAERCFGIENPDEGSLSMDTQINKTCTCLPSSSFKITAFTGNTKPCL